MFGQPFGPPTTQAPAFGTSTFGTSTFGAQPSLFGQPQQPQPAQPAFGTSAFGGAAFGAQPSQPANPFATAGSSFGTSTNMFGQPSQPAQSGNLFGGTTGGLFGQPAAPQPQQQASVFGQPQSTGMFGGGSTAGGLFGQPAKPTGFGTATGTTFGQPAQPASTSLFGQPSSQSSGGLFGSSTATAGGGGLFGTQPAATSMFSMSAQSGSTIKFAPLVGQDSVVKNGATSNVTTKNYCICTMKEYDEKKSMEEIRLEDYQANRKVGTPGSSTAGTMFGASQQPSSSGGLFGGGGGFGSTFGQPAKPATFGASTGGLFGQPTTSQPSTGLFGAAAPQSTSLFGNAPAFGQAAASAAPAFNFGASTSTTSFGGGAFGQQAAKPSLFGASGFGAAPATTSAPSLFGSSTAAPAFGAPASGAFNFGQPATSQPSLFGAKPFGAPTTTAAFSFGGGSLFGSKPSTTSAFSFGTSTTTSSGFGGATSAFPSLNLQTQQPASTSIFGAAKPFGTTTTAAPFGGSSFGGFSQPAANPFATGSVFGQPAAGGSSLFSSSQPTIQTQSPPGGNVHAQMVELLRSSGTDTAVLSNMVSQLPPRDATSKPAPLSRDAINTFIANAKRNYVPAAGNSREDERVYKYYVAPNSKEGGALSPSSGPISWRPAAAKRDDRFRLDRAYIEKMESEINSTKTPQEAPRVAPRTAAIRSSRAEYSGGKSGRTGREDQSSKVTPPVKVYNVRAAFDQEDSGSKTAGNGAQDDEGPSEDQENLYDGELAIKSSRPDYYTIPALHELMFDADGACMVEEFLVGRYSYGSVQFLGKTNIARMNIDELVEIEDKEVSVYPNENKKPPVGKGLNKKAVVTFDNVWVGEGPEDTQNKSRNELEEFIEILRMRVAAMDGAEFVDYDRETGRLMFTVQHFSKYKLVLTGPVRGEKRPRVSVDDARNKKQSILVAYSWEKKDGSDDSSKENSRPFGLFERNEYVSDGSYQTAESTLYNDASKDVEAYFRENLADTEGDGFQQQEKVVPTLVAPIESDKVVTEYGNGEKPTTGNLAGRNGRDFVLTTENYGEFMQSHVLQNPDVTAESRAVLEDQFELYLSCCQQERLSGETLIVPPESSTRFVDKFCDLMDIAIEPGSSLVHEKIIWELFRVLYGELTADAAQDTSKPQCRAFAEWTKSAVRLLHPEFVKPEAVREEDVTKALFHCVLCGDLELAIQIALHFKLYVVASLLQAADEGEAEQRDAAEAAVAEFLDHTMATIETDADQQTVYLVKTFMLLAGLVRLSDCRHIESFSLFEGLNWLECLCVCTSHTGDARGSLTGIWSYVQRYEENAAADEHCVMPSESSSIPTFVFDLILHYCRFSISRPIPSLPASLEEEPQFESRTKWFLMRLLIIAGVSISQSVELSLTSRFALAVRAVGLPHVAIAALLHLRPDRRRRNEIRAVALSLAEMGREEAASLEKFLIEDLGVSSAVLAESQILSARKKGDRLAAAFQSYQAEQLSLCRDVVTRHALPVLASCNQTTYQEVLTQLHFLDDSDDLMQPYGAFLEMLRLVEDVRHGEEDKKILTDLERITEYVEDNKDKFATDSRRDLFLSGFINRKLEEAKAFFDYDILSDD